MTHNPYEPPVAEPDESEAVVTSPSPRLVRKGVPAVLAILWNGPMIAVLYFCFSRGISPRTLNLLMAGWAAMIPVNAMLVAHVPLLQRIIYLPHVDMQAQRRRLWALAALWSVIVTVWVVATLFGGEHPRLPKELR